MKILFTCELLSAGGAERVCVDLANGLNARGHQVMILTDLTRKITYKPEKDITLVQIDNSRAWFRLIQLKQMISLFKDFKPDVVVCILYTHATIAKIASLLTIDCPIISSDHNSFERPSGAEMNMMQKLDKFYRNFYFDSLTVLTNSDRRFLKNRFKNIFVMPNPLTYKPLTEVPVKEKIVLAVGRLNVWYVKGFDLLLGAWNSISKDYKDWQLYIVGDGNEESKNFLKKKTNGLDSVKFYPYTENILDFYNKSSIFVLSSRCEGFGLVLIEAMSQGCAVVACDYNGRQADIVNDHVNGLLCDTDNELMLEEKLVELIRNEELRIEIQNNAIKSLSNFDLNRILDRWEHLFEFNLKKRDKRISYKLITFLKIACVCFLNLYFYLKIKIRRK